MKDALDPGTPDMWREFSPLTVTLTCDMCPEQYEVQLRGISVGYIRVRHGQLTVEFPTVGGRRLINMEVDGDGAFSNEERPYLMRACLGAIQAALESDVSKRQSAPEKGSV